MVRNKNLGNQLGAYLNEMKQRERNLRNASVELEDLLFAEVGLVWELATKEEPFQWAWILNWAKVFSPKEAFEWIKAGIFDAEEAYQMKEDGQSPGDKGQEN